MKSTEVNFDQLLSSAGEFGLYQVLLMIATFPFYWFGVFTYFGQLFMTEVSANHWCWVPELAGLTPTDRRNIAIPSDANTRFGYSHCYQYTANWTEVLATETSFKTSWSIEPCLHGWEFNKTEIPYPTITSEMQWVCEKNTYPAAAQSIFFVGSIAGGFLVGWAADRYGRIPAAVFSNMIGCIAGISSAFAKNFAQFIICRFFMGMSFDSCMTMVYLLVIEYVGPKYRTLAANLPFAVFYTSGLVALPWIALACGDWKTISLVTSIPMSLSLLTPFLMSESPRWMLSKGRVDETVNKVLKIGHVNKKEVPKKLLEEFKLTASQSGSEEKSSLLIFMKRPVLLRIFLTICVEFMCCMVVFDCLVRTISQLGYDFFLSFTIVSATEFPALMLLSFILDWSGRKWLTFTVFLIYSLFCILTNFVEKGLPSLVCAVVARFAMNMSTNTVMQWATELFPTPVRGTAVSMVHVCGYVGTVISPFIVYLGAYKHWLPLVIVSAIAAFGAILALFLPETTGRPIPQTFEEAESFVKNQGIFYFPCLEKPKV